MSIKNLFRSLLGSKSNTTSTGVAPKGSVHCVVCGETVNYHDSVDFNRSCADFDDHGPRFEFAGKPVAYFLCDNCGFCFAPEFQSWTFEEFSSRIYNDEYVKVDPDYEIARPNHFAAQLENSLGQSKDWLRHLDYGGGSGLMSRNLQDKGWNSQTYDPFADRQADLDQFGDFDIVTAFEVFEHVVDVADLCAKLKKLCRPDGMILFTTQCSDHFIARDHPLNWWYAAPRNGHISLFSKKSLHMIFAQVGLTHVSITDDLHAAFHEMPAWASHIFAQSPA